MEGGPGEGPGAGNGRAGAAARPGECGCQRRAAEPKDRALNKGIEAGAVRSHSGVRWEGSSWHQTQEPAPHDRQQLREKPTRTRLHVHCN